MGLFRVFFDVGWSSVVVRAANREEAVEKVRDALTELSHGAVKGLSLGNYTVSGAHALTLEESRSQEGSVEEFLAPPRGYAKASSAD